MIEGSRVSVTDAATALNTPGTSGQRLRIENTGAAAIDLGDAGVVTGEGFELGIDTSVDVDLDPGDQLFAISAATQTNIVHVLVT